MCIRDRRLIGAAALDAVIYEEVESDPGATAQAMAVVVLSSIAWCGFLVFGAASVVFLATIEACLATLC